jgi:hypothetical protein
MARRKQPADIAAKVPFPPDSAATAIKNQNAASVAKKKTNTRRRAAIVPRCRTALFIKL